MSDVWDEHPPPACPDHGARVFEEWAVSHLPAPVRAAYGYRMVVPLHSRRACLHRDTTVIAMLFEEGDIAERHRRHREHRERVNELARALGKDELPEVVPAPPPDLTCAECRCTTVDERARCLMERFYDAYRRITPESLADWYAELPESEARDVLAFVRAESQSDPFLRKAHGEILKAENGVRVSLPGGRSGRGAERLRDAFMLTAIEAAHEEYGLGIAACIEIAADVFSRAVSTVHDRWKAAEVRKLLDLHKAARAENDGAG